MRLRHGGSERGCQAEVTLHTLISLRFLRRQLPRDGFTTAINGPDNPGQNAWGNVLFVSGAPTSLPPPNRAPTCFSGWGSIFSVRGNAHGFELKPATLQMMSGSDRCPTSPTGVTGNKPDGLGAESMALTSSWASSLISTSLASARRGPPWP
jgi:hypothetical protein